MKFQVTVDRDEDGILVMACPAIPGCISQGGTKAEALANIREAIRLCLEVRAERDLPLTVETYQVEVRELPSASSRKVVKAFQSLGWEVARRESSRIILVKEGKTAALSVPAHNPVAKGTLRGLIRAAGLTVDEFVAAL